MIFPRDLELFLLMHSILLLIDRRLNGLHDGLQPQQESFLRSSPVSCLSHYRKLVHFFSTWTEETSRDSIRRCVPFHSTLQPTVLSKRCGMQRKVLAVTLGSMAAFRVRNRWQRYDIRFAGPATAVWWKEAIRESKALLSG